MELQDVMRTTFAAREFTDDPLTDEALHRILNNARFAASGGNRQGWRVIAVREQGTREALAEFVLPVARRYVAQAAAGENPWNSLHPPGVDQATIDATEVPRHLIAPLLSAPVVLIVCVDLGVVASIDQYLDRVGITSGASIYPFVWNILLAARNDGFGGTITTFVTGLEVEVKALLDIPEHVAVAAAVPLGRPVRQLTRLRRKPVGEFATQERWSGETLG